MKTIKNFLLFLLIGLLSCTKTIDSTCLDSSLIVIPNEKFETQDLATNFNNKIFILNEGGFTNGNASISAYDWQNKNLVNNVFESINNYPLGDILQSITRHEDLLYLCVNNSQKIEIVKESTFERYKTIAGLSSPRYLLFNNESEFWVTDLFENNIEVLDKTQDCSLRSIETNGWTEEIFKIGQYFWVLERNGIGVAEKFANLLKINASSFQIEQRISISEEPNSIVIDSQQNLWVLSSGIESENKAPQLIKVNTTSNEIEKKFIFDGFENIAQNLVYNKSEQALYFSKAASIFKMFTNSTELPNQPIFETEASIIYEISIQPEEENIYISDAIDFVSPGKVYIYTKEGVLIDVLNVGIIPSKILF